MGHRHVLAAFVVSLGTTSALAADQCPPLKVMASVDMVPLKNGRFMVPVSVAGHQEYFVVATANPLSSVSSSLADEFKLPRGHSGMNFVDMSGQVTNKLATLPTFGIGKLEATSVTMLMVDSGGKEAPPEGARVPTGTLGADFLRAYDTDLDFGAQKMNLISREHCADNVLYWNAEKVAKLPMSVDDTGKIHFKMTLDGHELDAVLNTAVPKSTIRMSVAKDLYDVDNDTIGNQREGALANGTPLYSHAFKNLDIEGLNIANPKLVLMPSFADAEIHHMQAVHGARSMAMATKHQPELVVGMAELRQLHVYIDYHHQTIYFTPVTKGGDFPKTSDPAP
jgi:hypothetical protein